MSPNNPNQFLIGPGAAIDVYRVTERIGKGGFAEVWSAWDERLKRVVAIKIIPLMAGDGNNTIQFKREATLIARLEHPHILPLYDFGETPEFRFLVMRYVTGGSLAQRIERQRLPISEILRLMMPVATTLDYLHEQRVVHRDLKPGNILLDAQDVPYLTDFGLAKSLSDTTTPMHSVSGTLSYMPPEQFAGGRMSIQSDQFSFGIMLYQLFTGTLPNKDQATFGMRQITGTQEVLPDVTLSNPDLPAGLNDFLRHLTAARPEDRPASASAVMQGIVTLLHGVNNDTDLSTTPSLTLALESAAYRQREAESLLNECLAAWESDQFTLSATHYILLNMLLSDLDMLLTPAVRSLMIRGAFEYGMQPKWWQDSSDKVQQRACWHAIRFGGDAARVQALNLAVNMPWISQTPPDIIEINGKGLFPLSAFTVSALQFLKRAIPVQSQWQLPGTAFTKLDENLAHLAVSQPVDAAYRNLPVQAASLIGLKRRTAAAQKLPLSLNHLNPLLTVYEQAGSLPGNIPASQRLKVSTILALRQLTRQPLQAFQQYLWAAAGNMLAFGAIIFVIGWPRFINSTQLINQTISYGLLYGLLLGAGVWVARHISSRLMVVPRLIRMALGALVGGLIVAAAFALYNQVALDNSLDSGVALYSGLLYVGGFAIGFTLPLPRQLLCGAGGIVLALLIPWISYLQTDTTPVIDFGDLSTATIIVLILAIASTVALLTFGYRSEADRKAVLWRDSVTGDGI